MASGLLVIGIGSHAAFRSLFGLTRSVRGLPAAAVFCATNFPVAELRPAGATLNVTPAAAWTASIRFCRRPGLHVVALRGYDRFRSRLRDVPELRDPHPALGELGVDLEMPAERIHEIPQRGDVHVGASFDPRHLGLVLL
ncbi:MAG TPA: hypothetical protein VML54_01605 [Candidatus Limnocylindrales bacterium]|nr:hypothetical protein [Candidatus Limnocylindrales bacterium]